MPMNVSYMKKYLSGGGFNADPNASLGGAISSTEVAGQTVGPTQISGVTFVTGFSNPEGDGTLQWNQTDSILSWKPFGSPDYVGQTISGDGQYVLGDSNGYVVVDVVVASLPLSSTQDNTVPVVYVPENLFDNVSALDSLEGDTEYRCIYIKNTHPTDTAFSVKVFIRSQPTGPDSLAVGLDPAGIGDGTSTGVATTSVDEDTAPAGVVFSAPSSSATGLVIGDLTPGDAHAVWIQRSVPVDNTQQEANDLSAIGFSALL